MTTIAVVLTAAFAAAAATRGRRPDQSAAPHPRPRRSSRLVFGAAAGILAAAVLTAVLTGQPGQASARTGEAAPPAAVAPAPEFHLASVSAPELDDPVAAYLAALAAAAPAPPPPDPTQFVWPAHGPIWSPFGPRPGEFHAGDDIGAPRNSTIVAARAGTVVFAGVESGYGNETRIDHGDGIVTVYAHQAKLFVGAGQHVEQGQAIGLVGSTGRVTAPHLHFEVRVNNVPQDPMRWLRNARD